MKKAILYTQVTGDGVPSRELSLSGQLKTLQVYCEVNKIEVVSHFEDYCSTAQSHRPGWKALVENQKKTKTKVDFALATTWSRFSRNYVEGFLIVEQLRKLGIQPNAVEQPLDLKHPENCLSFAIYMAQAEVERKLGEIQKKYKIQI